MKECYLEILKKIEKSGFVAYIVGGFVRDLLLGIENYDIDIITNATPKDLKKIFNRVVKTYDKYGIIKLKINNEIIDIATFRKEIYNNNQLEKIEYISSLEEDLKRRDFTINTFCMDSSKNIIDLLDAKQDLDNKIIKTVRDTKIEFKEDPSRILRAIRFMSELDFTLDNNIIKYIKENKTELNKISYIKRKQELDRLFKTKKVTPFLKFIKEFNLEEHLGIKSNNFTETNTIIGVWSQLETNEMYPFSKREKKEIKQIKELLKKGKIDKYDIYKNGMYIIGIVAEILKLNKKELNLIYTNLPIKGIMDIDIKSEEICKYLNISPSKELGIILSTLEKEIINGSLKNEKKEIKRRLNELR